MTRDCSTCSALGAGGKCLKGDSAEIYCMGGGYELWTSSVVPQTSERIEDMLDKRTEGMDTLDTEVLEESENITSFTAPEVPYGNLIGEIATTSIDEIEKRIGRPLTDEERQHFLDAQKEAQRVYEKVKSGEITDEDLHNALDPQQQAVYKAMQETLTNLSERPKTTDEGFNGVKKDGSLKSPTCGGCKHHSMVGCFLGKYYDCVDNKRYLYEPLSDGKNHVESIEAKEERVDDEKAVDFIDKMMRDKDFRSQ